MCESRVIDFCRPTVGPVRSCGEIVELDADGPTHAGVAVDSDRRGVQSSDAGVGVGADAAAGKGGELLRRRACEATAVVQVVGPDLNG